MTITRSGPWSAVAHRTFLDADRLFVDSRLRYEIGLRVEGPTLARLGAAGAQCVEIGTGRRGLGARIAVSALGAAHVRAFDVHRASLDRSRQRTADLDGAVSYEVGDATALPVDDGCCDLVLSLHALHHILDWRAAVRECARVLRPGGQLAFAEMDASFIDNRALRAVARHPADRFDVLELVTEMERAGLQARGTDLVPRWGGRWVVGVAHRV